VAVLIPCRNEEATIESVVEGFASALPDASVYVFDNDSSDSSAKRAEAAGAIVRSVMQTGKGNVVRRMFADIDADCYILVDGDGTYDPAIAPRVAELVMNGDDLVNVARSPVGDDAFRAGHELGNRVFGKLLSWIFGFKFNDVLSGYKGCSRRLVKSFPVMSGGFEIETELVVHALQLNVSVEEISAPYRSRPEGSESKLDTLSDGAKILGSVLGLVRHGRPLAFFGALGVVLGLIGIVLGIPILTHFIHTGRVPRFPTAVLATGFEILAALSFIAGLVLDTVSRVRREQRMLFFLSFPGQLSFREQMSLPEEPRIPARW
jgi:glycosyltransferase involved in cell wall biosynthesis